MKYFTKDFLALAKTLSSIAILKLYEKDFNSALDLQL